MSRTKGRKPRRRSANGMGSIYKRTDGRWEGKVSSPDGTRSSVYGKSEQECVAAMQERLNDVRLNKVPVMDKRQSLKLYLTDWLETSVKPKRAASTYRNYKQMISLYIERELGHVRLTKLTAQHIERWETNMRQRKVKRTGKAMGDRTIQLCYAILRASLNRAVKLKLIGENPVLYIDTPAYQRPEVVPLDQDQVRQLLSVVKGTRLEAIWTVAISLSIRPAEALGLTWACVNWEKGTVKMEQQLQRDHNNKLTLTKLKTAKSKCTIMLPAVTMKALREHYSRQLEERVKAYEWEDHGYIFVTEGAKKGNVGGRPLGHRNLYRELQRQLKVAGLPPKSLYAAIRHTGASLLLAQGASIREIMEALRHTQMSLASDTYTHLSDQQRKITASRMDLALGEEAV